MIKQPNKEKNFVLKLKSATLEGLQEDLKLLEKFNEVKELQRYKPHIISEIEKRKKKLAIK